MVAVELCHCEQKEHNAEKLNTILKFTVICCLLDLLLAVPYYPQFQNLVSIQFRMFWWLLLPFIDLSILLLPMLFWGLPYQLIVFHLSGSWWSSLKAEFLLLQDSSTSPLQVFIKLLIIKFILAASPFNTSHVESNHVPNDVRRWRSTSIDFHLVLS